MLIKRSTLRRASCTRKDAQPLAHLAERDTRWGERLGALFAIRGYHTLAATSFRISDTLSSL